MFIYLSRYSYAGRDELYVDDTKRYNLQEVFAYGLDSNVGHNLPNTDQNQTGNE